ncbi:MAG TPA: AcrB/AcrD/AcrF family protein [Planctomycetes bacterium]|nr:AcrB/AcrD/AcrF family protein [Planctomycetota bacterium]
MRGSWINRIVGAFLRGPYSILLILLSLVAGGAALAITPREEDPQIVVPAANLLIQMPGASAAEVERQVSTRLEKLLAQIEGVEYVYSTSMPGQAVVTARFYVGEDREDSLVRLHDKVQANQGVIPPGVSGWVVSPLEIDDVPIVNVTLTSARYDDHALRRMAEELEIRLQAVENAGRTFVVGGRPRELTLTLSPQRMSSRGVDLARLRAALVGANVVLPAGALVQANDEARLQVGRFLSRPEEVGSLVVATHEGRPVFLREVADVRLGPAEATRHVRIAFGPAAGGSYDPAGPLPEGLAAAGESYPAVVVAVAKKRGSNAVWVSHDVQAAAQRFAREVLPPEVHLRITRDYGHSADEKVSELLEALWVAIAIVVALLAYALGWREGLIIALAVPITFSLTLLVNLLLGYTINRVTLFALILALGLVVDDPIVDVENVHRHLGEKRPQGLRARLLAVLLAVNEVRPPIILATLAVIVSFVPLFFITGMMGPYMAPMALNVPVAMLMSLLVAFTITPWLCLKLLVVEPEGHTAAEGEGGMQRAYRRLLGPLLDSPNRRLGLLGAVVALLALCVWLVVSGRVPLKMLPYDNKNELQVVLDLPEGTPLERTEAAAADLARVLTRVPEVTDVSWFCGTASPMDFNGLIRQYFLRAEPHQADLRVNLVHKKRREQQSHGLGLRLRAALEEVVRPYGGRIAIVEVPPGPPVVSTVVAEVRGPEGSDYAELVSAAARVRAAFAAEEGIVDVDDVSIAPQRERIFELDRTKAALHGVSEEAVSEALAAAFGGRALTTLRLPREVTPLEVVARLPRASRQRPEDLLALDVAGAEGMVPLRELGRLRETRVDQPIFHKQLEPVAYVFGETAGATPAEAVLSLQERVAGDPALRGYEIEWAGEGEWKITLEVFRDLGIAFAVAVLGIYVLLIYQTGSYLLPLVLLVAIPLTVIGIVPGFWLLNLVAAEQIGGVLDPVYFTATGMIGMIALAGIATRNAILLIEFVQEEEARGTTLRESLIRAGAVRTRAILLTAGTALLAAWPITLDPIFSGLAWALIFGLTVSTAFTLLVVPAVYFMVRGAPQEAAQETA